MSEKRITGRWLKLPLDELDKRMPEETPRMKRQRGLEGIKKIFKFFGIGTGTTYRTITGCRGHIYGEHTQSTPSRDFRASHQVNVPPPSFDDIVRREIAVHDYIRDHDGIPNDFQNGRT